jgi:hypothetical protein
MHKLPLTSRLKFCNAVALYRDDLEDILALLSGVSENVSISDHEYEFESFDEMARIRGMNVKALTIASKSPFVSLCCGKRKEGGRGLMLYAEGTEAATALFHAIEEKLARRQRYLTYIFNPWLWGALLGVVVFLSPKKDRKVSFGEATAADWLSLVCVVTVVCGCILSGCMRGGVFSKISLARPHEAKSWVKENGERILLVFVGAVFGSLGTAVGTWLIKLFN